MFCNNKVVKATKRVESVSIKENHLRNKGDASLFIR